MTSGSFDSSAFISGLTITRPGVVYVDNNRTDSYVEDGTISKPFKTIQAAIDAAPAYSIIIPAAGMYVEDINLTTIGVGIVPTAPIQIIGNMTISTYAGTISNFYILGNVQFSSGSAAGFSSGSLDGLLGMNGAASVSLVDIYMPSGGITVIDSNVTINNIFVLSDIEDSLLSVSGNSTVTIDVARLTTTSGYKAIYHTGGNLIIRKGSVVNSSLTEKTIESTGGLLKVSDVIFKNTLGGPVGSCDNGASTAVNGPNEFSQVAFLPRPNAFVCGTAHTYFYDNPMGYVTGSKIAYNVAELDLL
jgi:hypothetical protein